VGYSDAWNALALDMPEKIPRTEYSVTEHWPLIEAVTGIKVDHHSSFEEKLAAGKALMEAWDFGLVWSVLVVNQYFKGPLTDMGHAEWAVGGVDFNDKVTEPFKSPEEVLAYDPMAVHGQLEQSRLVADFNSHYQFLQHYYPDAVHMTGTYVTLFSGLINIFGWNMLLLAGGTDMHRFGNLVLRYESWIKQFFDAYAETDIPIMMVHDDITWSSGPVFPPDWYRQYIFPAYKRLWKPVIESGKKILFTCDGDYSLFLDDLGICREVWRYS
jgi:hypothetical protein